MTSVFLKSQISNHESQIARDWLDQLAAHIETRGLRGYDPFDIKEHPLIRAAQPYTWPRRITTGLCDLFPTAARRLLGIEPQENAKSFALVALGNLRLYEARREAVFLERAERHLEWLRGHVSPGYSGMCWGYPFNVFAKGLDTPKGTPIGVVSAIAGEAFALAHRLTQHQAHLEAVRSIAAFFLKDIPRLPCNGGGVCFGYTPSDRRRVHNANLHAVAHLYRTYYLTNDVAYRDAAEPALKFTLDSQRPDGTWPYGEWDPAEPYEKSLLSIIDHHHTGFVLRSLFEIHAIAPEARVRHALDHGYAYYRDHLFAPDGMPIMAAARYPVDIHACAEAILCPAVLSRMFPDGRDTASRALTWTRAHMRAPRTGMPYYRRYPFFTSRLLCARWGLAWMFLALCEFTTASEASPSNKAPNTA